MKNRCDWCKDTFSEYVSYHDLEWGVPVTNDRTHFEFLILESAQAGLSWSTILKKREGYREAFAGFDVDKVALFSENDIQRLKTNPGIVRNELKIRSAIKNARHFIEIREQFGSFTNYIWSFVDGKPIDNCWKTMKEVPATTPLSDAFSKELKERGFKFVGSTIIYSHMQATGLVNDHLVSCFRHSEITHMHKNFKGF